jgi:hypothetical protein
MDIFTALFFGFCAGVIITILSRLRSEPTAKNSGQGSTPQIPINLNIDKEINIKVQRLAALPDSKIFAQINEKFGSLQRGIDDLHRELQQQGGRLTRLEEEGARAQKEETVHAFSQEDEKSLISLWTECASEEKFSKRVEGMGYKFHTYSGKDPYTRDDCSSEDIWVVSKEAKGFLFPAWNRMPAYGLRFFYKSGPNEYQIRVIKKLAEVSLKDEEWILLGEKGELGV